MTEQTRRALRDVVVVVDEGVSPFEMAVACEVFGIDRSAQGLPRFDFAVCSPRPGAVRTKTGFGVLVEHGLDRLDSADLVVVAPSHDDACTDGRSCRLGPEPGPDLTAALRAAVERGATVASLCAATFTLARAGLLDGRRATTHWMYTRRLAEEFTAIDVVPDVLYVEDGPVATSAGTAAAIDLCLHLLRCSHGTAVANAVARRMVVPPHRDGGQAQFVQAPVRPCTDDSLQRALEWAQANLQADIDVAGWAQHAVMSPRTFARRFRDETGLSPHRWLLEQRVHLARLLLEEGDESVDEVARRCGFGSPAMLRQHFTRLTGTTPTSYRRTFRGAGSGLVPA
ncbi:GlxA family transcriptional regulator [Kineococcus glutinatus]|uniref:Helix-turn-helix domain-containing protein n=1 Tax=Kineococcus glutinatus TaxID=1070872 RepID=A0ABP9H554_9ACTN